MSQRLPVVFLTLAVALGLAPGAGADEPKKPAEPSLNDLSLEVAALQTMYSFKLKPEQLNRLKELAGTTAAKPRERKAAKASDEFRKALEALREALAQDLDDAQVDPLQEQLDGLRDAEMPELDDGVEITAAARRQVPALFKQLTARQVAHYLGDNADEMPVPQEKLVEALDKVRTLNNQKWKELRDDLADEIGWLVAGLDEAAAGKVSDKVVALLSRARGLTDEEFKKQQAELEKEAARLVADAGPTDVLRHFAEHALAELLSNPQLAKAVQARLNP
jgi:hypothetical protein